MLETCFIHLSGVGVAFESKLRACGITCWDDALSCSLPCGEKRAEAIRSGIIESQQRLSSGDAAWFGRALPPAQQWRLFPHFYDRAAYVDIETTGLSSAEDHITTIALYDGRDVRVYVQGENLEAFADDILQYQLLVTWNGRSFDAPILRRTLGIPLDKGDMAHLDLLPVFRSLGLRGGLKRVEQALGLGREGLDGVDGFDAVWLWREYTMTGDRRALETLLAYNVADVLSLESLAHYAVQYHLTGGKGCVAPAVRAGCNPYLPCQEILSRLPGRGWW